MTTYSVQFTRDNTDPLDPHGWLPADARTSADAVGVALNGLGQLALPWLQGGDFWAHVATGSTIDLPCLIHSFKLHPSRFPFKGALP
jgi:hypothetical protein